MWFSDTSDFSTLGGPNRNVDDVDDRMDRYVSRIMA